MNTELMLKKQLPVLRAVLDKNALFPDLKTQLLYFSYSLGEALGKLMSSSTCVLGWMACKVVERKKSGGGCGGRGGGVRGVCPDHKITVCVLYWPLKAW